jgi:DNA polymerase III epsilon subunit-like protein
MTDLIVVDVETTGLDPFNDVCVEIGWENVRTGEQGVFIPKHDSDHVLAVASKRALEINGYRERILGQPQDEGQEELTRLYEVLDGDVMGGSNIRTDAIHLYRLFQPLGEPWYYHLVELSSYVSGVLGLPPENPPGLAACCDLLGVQPEAAVHSALAGATTTANCFRAARSVLSGRR